jgi:hypothetical protein
MSSPRESWLVEFQAKPGGKVIEKKLLSIYHAWTNVIDNLGP